MLLFVLDLSPGPALRQMTYTLGREVLPGLDRNVACAVVTTEGYLVAESELMNPENKERMAAAVMGLCAQAHGSVRLGMEAAWQVVRRRDGLPVDIFLLTDERPRRPRWFRGARVVPAC